MATPQRELQSYLAKQVYENAADIAPELVDLVGGNSKEEIDLSITRVKSATAGIVASIGSVGFTDNVRYGTTANDAQLAEQINAMSVEEFGAYRAQLDIR